MDRIVTAMSCEQGRSPGRVAVLGAGFIGLEMVEAFSRRGLEVTVRVPTSAALSCSLVDVGPFMMCCVVTVGRVCCPFMMCCVVTVGRVCCPLTPFHNHLAVAVGRVPGWCSAPAGPRRQQALGTGAHQTRCSFGAQRQSGAFPFPIMHCSSRCNSSSPQPIAHSHCSTTSVTSTQHSPYRAPRQLSS
jgi:hypothetical protein